MAYIKSASPKSLSGLDAQFGWKAPDTEVDLRDMVQEFQGLRLSYCAGGTASAALTLLGSGGVTHPSSQICTDDTVVGALVSVGKGGTSGITSFSLRNDVRIHATAGTISISGAATTSQQVILLWYDKTGYLTY